MTKFLISFPSEVMVFPPEDFDTVFAESHAVIEEAKAAGVYIFGGGIAEEVDPVRVAANGTITPGAYAQTGEIKGGFTILELPSREAAMEWGAKIAAACRCDQEVREFMFDPHS